MRSTHDGRPSSRCAALRSVKAVIDLVGDQVIVVVERCEHREPFDVHCLDREADAEVKDDRQHDDFDELAQERTSGRRSGGRGGCRRLRCGGHTYY